MRHGIRAIVLLLGLLASVLPAQAARVSQVWINEILYDPAGADSAQQIIELHNRGASATAMGNWSICIQFNYKRFPTGATIQPGGYYIIHVNATGVNDATNWYTGAYVNIHPAADGVSLYHTFSGFSTTANIEDFVQWGAGGQPRENVAAAAGLWTTGLFVARAVEGKSVQFLPAASPPTLPHPIADYCNSAPTIGAVNACAPSVGPLTDVRISEVLSTPAGSLAGQTRAELVNGGLLPVPLDNLNLCAQGSCFAVTPGLTLPPGARAVVHFNESGASTAANIYSGAGVMPDLDPLGGSLALYRNGLDFNDPANIFDFIEWSAAGQSRESVAAAAGLWTAGAFFPPVLPGASLQWRGLNDGNLVDDWCADVPTLGLANVCSSSGANPDSPSAWPRLLAGAPNPGPPGIMLSFVLNAAEPRVRLVLFDLAGRPVRTLHDGPAPAGGTTLRWDGADDHGAPLPAGIYFQRLDTGRAVQQRKITLIR